LQGLSRWVKCFSVIIQMAIGQYVPDVPFIMLCNKTIDF